MSLDLLQRWRCATKRRSTGVADESFDRSVSFAGRLAREFNADLHVVYVIEEPLKAGWTAEMSPSRLPELHAAMEEEARERLGRLLPAELQERITIAIRTGDTSAELVRYTAENNEGALFWADRGVGYVVSGGSSDRERLTQVARLVYDQIEKSGG